MTRIDPNKPLSDAEVERLRAILESGRGGENCMTIEAVDGVVFENSAALLRHGLPNVPLPK